MDRHGAVQRRQSIWSRRMVLGFILFWVVLGLGVFFVAMRRPRGARDRSSEIGQLHTESNASQRAVTFGVVLVFAVGLIVPTLVLAHNAEDKASEAIGGVHLNAAEVKGRELFSHTCTVCHTLAAVKSVGRIGPDLDVRVGDDIATPAGRKALVLNAIEEGRARGNGNMPAQLYQGKEAEDIAAFVAAVAGH
jgi:mono/diheme cytochrome c family protein